MRLTDGREEEVTICCDVMVLRFHNLDITSTITNIS